MKRSVRDSGSVVDRVFIAMRVHVLLFDAGSDSEGIHSLEIAGRTVVLLFENPDDAERYAGLLEAQDFPVPTVESLEREDVDLVCRDAGYEARFVASGFVPESDEERLFMAPPEANCHESQLKEEDASPATESSSSELDAMRKRLEGLL